MSTRRTTVKGRTKRAAVRTRSGKSTPQGDKRAPAAGRLNLSTAAVGARLDAVEKKVRRAAHGAANVMHSSMDEAAAVGKVVRSSMKQAFAAVTRATRRATKRVSATARAELRSGMPAKASAKRPTSKAGRSAAA